MKMLEFSWGVMVLVSDREIDEEANGLTIARP
jgi:hypothetical protein